MPKVEEVTMVKVQPIRTCWHTNPDTKFEEKVEDWYGDERDVAEVSDKFAKILLQCGCCVSVD